MDARDSRICATCGRRFEWRRKWARVWQEVRYCSDACRRHRPGPLDRRLEEAISELLARRREDASICPSEAARLVFPDDWRTQLERTRRAARRLHAAGRVEITQRGLAVDPSRARGPIRIRLRRARR